MLASNHIQSSTLSQKITANLIVKNQKIQHTTRGIANGGVHFDWYFPNLYQNSNVDSDSDAKKVNQIGGGITYDNNLLGELLSNNQYTENYLELTGKYFRSIGIDFEKEDTSRDIVDYATAQGYKVRLNKIIESYKILMWGCEQGLHSFEGLENVLHDSDHIPGFYQELQKRYKRILCAFKKNSDKFNEISSDVQFGLHSLANCFEDDYKNKRCDDHIKKAIEDRPIYQGVFNNSQAPHKLIEQEIDGKARSQQEAGPALQRPAPASLSPQAPARPNALPPTQTKAPPPTQTNALPLTQAQSLQAQTFAAATARTAPADTLMRIRVTPDQSSIAKEEEKKDRLRGALYGQAIFDALGLTTEFLSRQQAKIFLSNSKCIEYSQAGNIAIQQEHIDNFLRDPYGIRKIKEGGYDPYQCIVNIKNPTGGSGDQQTSRWRQLVPKGSPTDDTDQAVLKFVALQTVQGDLESAKKIFAKIIVNWCDGGLKGIFGRKSFGLGSNTMEVMAISYQRIDKAGRQKFLNNPVARSKAIWEKNFLEQDFFTQANGALMSSSYILQYYPDSLELAQKATQELAKVTHYDPLVSAHCVAYVTMLYKLQNHQGELSDDNYSKYLREAFEAGEKILDERKGDYEELITHKQSQNLGYNYHLDAKITEWKNQMRKAIFSEIVSEKFEKWEDLELTNPRFETDPIKATKGSQPYDNIGMSHRALSAGFFALTRLRKKINTHSKTPQNALTEICLELMAQGGDTDTNGTVVGSLCGSYLGFSKIPQEMIDGFGRGNDGNGAGNIEDKDEQVQPKGFIKVKDKELLDEIKNIANQKICKLQDANVTDRIIITPATIIKPTFSMKFQGHDNFWANDVRPSDQYRRGNDYLVLNNHTDYMTQGNVDINAIQKVMANVISQCQKQLKMTDDEVNQAIILAKKYGGLGNVNEEKLSQDALIASYGVEEKKEKLNNFCQFSSMVQKLNQQNGIYSGRKDGKLVGLRLTFVSEEAILLWQQNSHFTIKSQVGAAAGGGQRGRFGGAGRDITGR